MITVLHVAEKPSVAKEIASVLGGGSASKRAGLSQYNPVHEFRSPKTAELDWLRSGAGQVRHVVTSVSGHLMALDFPSNYRSWRSCDPRNLFSAPVIKSVPTSMEKIARTLAREARDADVLLLWLDCDREGENICFEVSQKCNEVKRLDTWRAVFSDLTPRSIKQAFASPRRALSSVSDAVDARQEMDLRIGAAFTRFQTLRAQAGFAVLDGLVLSFGPCQFPTLGFVVDRYWQIESFVDEAFWSIECKVARPNVPQEVAFKWQRQRLFDKFVALALYESMCSRPLATVVSTNGRPVRKWKPLPLTTVELQKLASRKLKISSSKVMEIAEGIYRKGYISYPRTETDQFPDNLNYHSLISEQAQDQAAPWSAYARSLIQTPTQLSQSFVPPRRGSHNDQSHPPIHPTKASRGSLHGDDLRVYELIVRHFLACCSADGIGAETKVVIHIDGEYFSATGLVIHERNFLDVYPYVAWSGHSLPPFIDGETFELTSLLLSEGRTRPPSLLTEADLIALMDKNGIGTDATIAQHIKTIQERQYVDTVKVDGNQTAFTPTTLGCALIDAYNEMGFPELSLPQLRADTERWLQRVADGTLSKTQALGISIEKYERVFTLVAASAANLDTAMAKYFSPAAQSANPAPAPPAAAAAPGFRGPDPAPTVQRGLDPVANAADANGRSRLCAGHSEPCVLKKVQKAGPNQGRQFWSCPREPGEGCNFFEWHLDALPSDAARLHVVADGAPAWAAAAANNGAPPMCGHGEVCAIRTVRKEGPNTGRRFYSCPQTQETSCGFFEWINAPVSYSHDDASSGNSRNCFGCGQPGHFSSQCPNRGSSSVGQFNDRRGGDTGGASAAPAKRKPPTCGNCGQVGHSRRGCKESSLS